MIKSKDYIFSKEIHCMKTLRQSFWKKGGIL